MDPTEKKVSNDDFNMAISSFFAKFPEMAFAQAGNNSANGLYIGSIIDPKAVATAQADNLNEFLKAIKNPVTAKAMMDDYTKKYEEKAPYKRKSTYFNYNSNKDITDYATEAPIATQAAVETVSEESNGAETARTLYDKLGDKTQSKNVILPADVDPEADDIGMKYTTAIDFWRKIVPEAMVLYNKARPLVVAFRGNSKKTFLQNYNSGTHTIGNPFDWQVETGTRDEQGIKSTKRFIHWMITGDNMGIATATPEYRQAIIDDIKSGKIKNSPILYYQEKGYATHATAIDYLINKYDWNDQTVAGTEPKGKKVADGIYVNQDGLTPTEELELFNIIKPVLEQQAVKSNSGKSAPKMAGLSLNWDYTNGPTKRRDNGYTRVEVGETLKSNTTYGWFSSSVNGQKLYPITKRLVELMSKATGIDVTNYDGAIINIYNEFSFIGNHPDIDESITAKNYPVVVVNIGGPGNITLGTDKQAIPSVNLKSGAGYIFGFQGENRTIPHSTYASSINGTLPAITTQMDGETLPAGSYRISVTMRRVMPLEAGMPSKPAITTRKQVTTQSPVQTVIAPAVQGTPSLIIGVRGPEQLVDYETGNLIPVAKVYKQTQFIKRDDKGVETGYELLEDRAVEIMNQNPDNLFVFDWFRPHTTGKENPLQRNNTRQAWRKGLATGQSFGITTRTFNEATPTDEQFERVKEVIDEQIEQLVQLRDSGKIITFPSDGIGQNFKGAGADQIFVYLSKKLLENFGYRNPAFDNISLVLGPLEVTGTDYTQEFYKKMADAESGEKAQTVTDNEVREHIKTCKLK